MSTSAGLEDCYRWASMTRAAQKMSCSLEGENVLLGTFDFNYTQPHWWLTLWWPSLDLRSQDWWRTKKRRSVARGHKSLSKGL